MGGSVKSSQKGLIICKCYTVTSRGIFNLLQKGLSMPFRSQIPAYFTEHLPSASFLGSSEHALKFCNLLNIWRRMKLPLRKAKLRAEKFSAKQCYGFQILTPHLARPLTATAFFVALGHLAISSDFRCNSPLNCTILSRDQFT